MLAVTPASYVASHQQADGGFAETGSPSTPGLTAWAMLGLRSAGRPTGSAYDYLSANERGLQSATDIELALIAGLYAAGRTHTAVPLAEFKVRITAATLLFRTLTFGIQIPLGGFTYILWRRTARWRKSPPDAPATSLQRVPS